MFSRMKGSLENPRAWEGVDGDGKLKMAVEYDITGVVQCNVCNRIPIIISKAQPGDAQDGF